MTERAIGIDVGGTKIAAGVIDREGQILNRVERPTPTESREEFLELLDEIVDQLRGDGVAAIGFGLPSTIDQRTGRVVGSVHVPLADFDFRDHAAERFSVPVALDNDGNVAAIAEWKIGAGKGSDHMIMLTLGTGVGGGLILDGKPYRGFVGAGAEIGHMVLDYGGAPCGGNCTGHGHFEQVSSGGAADRKAVELLGPDATGRELVGAAREGNHEALEAIREIGRKLGAALGVPGQHLQPRGDRARRRVQPGARPLPRARAGDDEGRSARSGPGSRPGRSGTARPRCRPRRSGVRRVRGPLGPCSRSARRRSGTSKT